MDGNISNNRDNNLVIVCSLCHACYHMLDSIKLKRASLIWMPEMSQQELNWLVRWLELGPYCQPEVIRYVQECQKDLADLFKFRIKQCHKLIGTDNKKIYKNLKSIRLIPAYINDHLDEPLTYLNGYTTEQHVAWREVINILVPNPGHVSPYLALNK